MTKQELSDIGLTPDDVLNRLVERMCETYSSGDDEFKDQFESQVQKVVKDTINSRIDAAMQTHIVPRVTEMVDGICLTETNRWGEAKGNPVTFVEYLTGRVDAYIREEVNYKGKAQNEDSYNWSKSTTRIAYMINEHLQYHISQAMTKALGDATSSIRKGLEGAVKVALDQVKIIVNTEVKS